MKIKDILNVVTSAVIPQAEVHYHLYSLPSFDDNQTREELLGYEIQCNKYNVPDKCILFNKLNVRFKRVWRIDNADTNKICSTEFLPLVIDENKVDYNYCYYLLVSDRITNYLCGQNTNTSGSHKRIDPTDFLNIELPSLPSLSDQEAIGNLLSSIDKKIDVNCALNQNLEARAKQLYDYWFVQFDFPDEEGKPYKSSGGKMVWSERLKRDIPLNWSVTCIENILDKVTSTLKLGTNEYLTSGQFPIIDQTTDVYYAGFTDRDDAVVRQYPAVVFGDHSCAVKYVNFPFVRGADGTQIMLSKNPKISIEYLYYVVKDVRLGKGYARHFCLLKDHPIIVPERNVAENFENIVQKLLRQITRNREETLSLTKQRDELLPLLMNGQVSVNSDLAAD